MENIILLALVVICTLFCAAVVIVTAAIYFKIKYAIKSEPVPTQVEMTQEQFDKFAEADAERVSDFNAAIANLNAFMTGVEEDKSDVRKQER